MTFTLKFVGSLDQVSIGAAAPFCGDSGDIRYAENVPTVSRTNDRQGLEVTLTSSTHATAFQISADSNQRFGPSDGFDISNVRFNVPYLAGSCGDSRDSIAAEYQARPALQSYFIPSCADFVRRTIFFSKRLSWQEPDLSKTLLQSISAG